MGSFCKSLKIEKTIAYAFNNVLLNWGVTKEGMYERHFELTLVFQGGFGVCYIRVFSNYI